MKPRTKAYLAVRQGARRIQEVLLPQHTVQMGDVLCVSLDSVVIATLRRSPYAKLLPASSDPRHCVILGHFADHLTRSDEETQRYTHEYRRLFAAYGALCKNGVSLVDMSDSSADPVLLLAEVGARIEPTRLFNREKRRDINYVAPTMPFPFLFARYPDSY